MSGHALRSLAVLGFALLLSACAAGQQGAGAALGDSATSARQEFMADVMHSAGRVRQAVEGYDKALAARPGDALLHAKKGRALLGLHQPEAAWAEFTTALAASPELAAAQYGAGQALMRLGRNQEAREAFARAVALVPTDWRSRCALGVLLLNAGRADQAREQFLAALALPQVQPPFQGQGETGREELLNNLGVAQVLAGDSEAAVRTFRLAMDSARNPERSANNLGLLLVRLGRQAEAFAAFRAGGNDAQALNNLGYALYLQGNAQKARELFEKALDLSPKYYETAGENLKLAAQPAPTPRDGSRGAASGAGASVPAPGVDRISLTGQGGPALRFGHASLLGETGPRRWTH